MDYTVIAFFCKKTLTVKPWKELLVKNYIGLDAHSTTCTFVIINGNGIEIKNAQISTSERKITEFLNSVKGEKELVFEESGMSVWLHTILHGLVDKVVVCNPTYISKKLGSKNDYSDALHLAHELRKGHLITVFHDKDNIYIPLRILTSAYLDINKDIVATKNRLKAIFRAQGKSQLGLQIYSTPEKIQDLTGEENKFAADALMYQIQTLEEIKEKYIYQFKENMKTYKILKLLDSLPQVDSIRANILAAYTCDGRRFENKHKFWAYVGLVRYDQNSDGRSYGSKKIHGRSELKSVFISCAEGILTGESSLKKYYDQLRSKGLDHKAARKAVARRLAAIVLAIFKYEKPYDDKYLEKRKNNGLTNRSFETSKVLDGSVLTT